MSVIYTSRGALNQKWERKTTVKREKINIMFILNNFTLNGILIFIKYIFVLLIVVYIFGLCDQVFSTNSVFVQRFETNLISVLSLYSCRDLP